MTLALLIAGHALLWRADTSPLSGSPGDRACRTGTAFILFSELLQLLFSELLQLLFSELLQLVGFSLHASVP
jgi:hypothetical protein